MFSRSLSRCRRRNVLARVRAMSSEVFSSAEEHRAFLRGLAELPQGFRVGNAPLTFEPKELAPGRVAKMNLTLIALDEPTDSFAAMYTSNAFPGHPIRIGRRRLKESKISAMVINNRISNVGAPNGEADSEEVCAAVAREMSLDGPGQVLPSSTGIIGWKLPTEEMVRTVPSLVDSLQGGSVMPSAEGIMTTDLYPKVRSATVGAAGARVVGIAKGAGMVEPNMATMLVFLLTDADIDRQTLRDMLPSAVNQSFNCISIDSDQSTSDTVALASSRRVPLQGREEVREFYDALRSVSQSLAEDVVRNGEGVQHVIRVRVTGAPSTELARAVGKRVVNSPLFKTAVAGNDPNVGRLVSAIGQCLGQQAISIDSDRVTITFGGQEIFSNGSFRLNPDAEKHIHNHMVDAWMWGGDGQKPPSWFVGGNDVKYRTPVSYPPHNRCVEIEVDLGNPPAQPNQPEPRPGEATVLGGDLTHEYVAINADYRS